MSIINSIALGKASGKLGNIVFQTYKGQTVARQKNDSISTEPTDLQIAQRNRMYNCGRSFQYLSNFLSSWKPRSAKGLSNASYYTKLVSQDFLSVRALRGFQAVRTLAEKNVGDSSFLDIKTISIIETLGVKTGVKIEFNYLAQQWEDNLTMNILCSNIVIVGGTMPINSTVMRDVPITLENVTAGFIDINIEDFDNQFVVAFCSQYYSYSDSLVFSPVFE